MDYSFSAVKLIFSGSMMRQCVNITIIDDDLCERSESFFVQLAAFDPNIVLAPNQATSNIADNDSTLTSFVAVWEARQLIVLHGDSMFVFTTATGMQLLHANVYPVGAALPCLHV